MPWRPSDEDDGSEYDRPEEEGRPGANAGDLGERLGGWIPLDARTWRHPSELRAAQVAVALATSRGWRRGTAALVGTAALLAIAMGASLLASTGSSPSTFTLTTLAVHPAVTPCCRLSVSATRDAEASIVTLEPEPPRTAVAIGYGVVVADGIVATTLDALGGEHRIQMLTATGTTVVASVVAVDSASGIALLESQAALPAAPAPSASDAEAGSRALAVAMRVGSGGSAPSATWASGVVVSVGAPAPGKVGSEMAQICVRGASLPGIQGEPLVDSRGHLLGILDGSDGAVRSFLPMPLVAGVSRELETTGKVRHGWLDVTDTTAPGMHGAEVLWVDPSGAAAGALRPGDVIVRLNGSPVTSSADLRSMLYVMPPGSEVTLAALHAGRVAAVDVQLQPAP